MMLADLNKKNKLNKIYIENSLIKLTYPKYDKLLKSLKLKGISQDAKTFFFNGLFREYGHKFIWSTGLLKSVMESLGYKNVIVFSPGSGHKKEYCIERKQRGIYLGDDWQKDARSKKVYDPESLGVEGIK